MRTRVCLSVVLVGLAVGMLYQFRSNAAEPKAKAVRQQIEEAFKLQSYNQAIARAEALLKANPAKADADWARRMIGLSQARLGNHQQAQQALFQLLKADKEYERDAEVVEAIAESLANHQTRPVKEIINWYNRAIGLRSAENNTRKQIDLLFRLAELIQATAYNFGEEGDDHRVRFLRAVVALLDVLDRALQLEGTRDDQIRALQMQAAEVAQYAHALRDLPREQWPAGLQTKHDLSKPIALAISFEREIAKRFPEHPGAAAALIRIGHLHEHEQDFLAALPVFQEVIDRFPRLNEATQAKQRIAFIKAPGLTLGVQGITLPGAAQKPVLDWTARNVPTIKLAAYPVELFDVLRKVQFIYQADKYSLKGIKPVAEWQVETKDQTNHKILDGKTEAPLPESNAYIVVAAGVNAEGKGVEARALVIVSRLGLLVKSAQHRAACFAVDALTGAPKPGTKVLVQRLVRTQEIPILGTRHVFDYKELTVPDSGLAETAFNKPAAGEEPQHQLIVIARQGNDYAMTDAGYHWYWWGFADGYRVYSFTDRPVYRPEQTVHFKHIARLYENGDYQPPQPIKATVRITDPRGEAVYEKAHVANEDGSFSGSFVLGERPTLGMYHMHLTFDGERQVETGPGAAFRVEEYKKPEFQVTIQTDKPTYKVGDRLKATIHGEYYFGGAVANANVTYSIHRFTNPVTPYWRRPFDWLYEEEMGDGIHGMRGGMPVRGPMVPHRSDLVMQGGLMTDSAGNVTIEFDAKPFEQTPEQDLQFRIHAQMIDQSRREIHASTTLKVTHRAFTILMNPRKHLYQPGDRARIDVKSQNPNGGPVAFKGSAVVSLVTQREERDNSGNVTKQEKREQVSKADFAVDADGQSEFAFAADRKGLYRVDIAAPDPYGGAVESHTYVWVAEGQGEFAHYANRDLEMVIESDTVAVGDTLRVLLNSKHKEAYVLLSAEAEDLYLQRVVYIPGTQATVEIPVARNFQPNVTLKAALFRNNQVYFEDRDLRVPPVQQFLTLTIKAPKSEFLPRESAEIEVDVRDHTGKPVEAEISLGCVDASIFYIQDETRGDIRKFYFARQRPLMVGTHSSYAFQFWAHGREMGMGGMAQRFALSDAAPAPMAVSSEAAPEGMRGGPAALKAAAGGEAPLKEAEVRSEFPDTVFWAAHLKTGPDGKARTTIRFPDSLTTWRLAAIGSSRSTQVGEIKHEVQTRKNIIVRLQGPRFFVEKDRVVLSAIAHNYLAQPKRVRVSFETTSELVLTGIGEDADALKSGEPSAQQSLDIEVPAGGEKRVDVLADVRRPGRVRILAKAQTDIESDAVQMDYDVLEYGAEKLIAESGILAPRPDTGGEAVVTLDIPKQIRDGSQKLTVQVSPTIAAVMLESLPYLLDYPYGCTEQTMSRFLPAVFTSHTLKTLGMDLAEIKELSKNDPKLQKRFASLSSSPVYDRKEMEKMIDAGVKRLADFQRPDGGWGWWKNDQSNPYISAYVVSGLAVAREAGVTLPKDMLERGTAFLITKVAATEPVTQFPWQRNENMSVRAYMLYAIGQANRQQLRQPDVAKQLRRTFELRDELNDYSRALLALALNAGGLAEEAGIVLGNIKDRARIEDENQSASWGDYRGYYYWYQSGTEATSFSLRALLTLDPESPLVRQAVNWLVRHRQGTRWFNTKDTAIACYALADYLQYSKELDPDLTITVAVDGKQTKEFRVTRQNLFTFDSELSLAAEAIGTGPKRVSIRRQGKGNLYWTAFATFFTREEKITEAGNEIFVHREYHRLVPREVEKTRTIFRNGKQVAEKYKAIEYDKKAIADGEPLASGDLIEVSLAIDAKNNFEYLIFEDPKPAGCEPVELQSGHVWGGGLGAHMELRDELVAFFATYLNQGKHNISYRLRAEVPGTFHALPARAECMYTPLVRGNAESRVLRITSGRR